MLLHRNEWFKRIMGQTEDEWIKQPTIPTQHEIGQFSTPSLGELYQQLPPPPPPPIRCPEFVIYVMDPKHWNDQYFDTSSLQLMDYPTHRPVMFQVASNFNCQENGSHMVNFKHSNYLTHLMSDSTQGPSASAGAGVGAIYRLLLHLTKKINLLNQTPYGSQVVEGKFYAPKHLFDLSINQIKIGLHTNLSANFDRSSFDHRCLYFPQGKVIDQVFTATVIYPTPAHHRLTSQLLLAGYVGTYLAAIIRQTEILVLTLLGGGAFRNPHDLIIQTLVQAHCQYASIGHLKQVILPLYDPDCPPEPIVNQLLAVGYPPELIKIHKH